VDTGKVKVERTVSVAASTTEMVCGVPVFRAYSLAPSGEIAKLKEELTVIVLNTVGLAKGVAIEGAAASEAVSAAITNQIISFLNLRS
jgi:hypothetical protein